MSEELSHVDGAGKLSMVDVSGKRPVRRVACAKGRIVLAPATIRAYSRERAEEGRCADGGPSGGRASGEGDGAAHSAVPSAGPGSDRCAGYRRRMTGSK